MVDCVCTNFPAGLGNVTIGANLGIGTNPGEALHVLKPNNPIVKLESSNHQNPAYLLVSTPTTGSPDVGTWEIQGETGMIFGYTAPAPLHFRTLNTTRMTIGGDGNVGIGIDNPSALLDAAGHTSPIVRLRCLDNQNPSYQLQTTGATGKVQLQGAGTMLVGTTHGPLHLQTNNENKVTILSDGNVGIGTTTPGATRLLVRSPNDAPSTAIIQAMSANGTVGVSIGPSSIALVGDANPANLSVNSKGTGFLLLQNTAGTGNVGIGPIVPAAKLRVGGTVAADGNVGIGRSDPLTKLDIQGGPAADATKGIRMMGDSLDFRLFAESATVGAGYVGTMTAHTLRFFTGGVANVGVTLDQSARVGIGTTAPSEKLHVSGPNNPTVEVESTSSQNPAVALLSPGGTGKLEIQGNTKMVLSFSGGTPGTIELKAGNVTDPQMVVQPGGSVGVGTLSPQARLHVAGTTTLDGNVGIGVFGRSEKLAVFSPNSTGTTNIGAFWASNSTVGVGIGQQDVRQIQPGQPISLNAGTTGAVRIGDVSTGHVTLATGGGKVGVRTADPQAILDVAGTIRATSQNIPLTGAGVEILYSVNQGSIDAYDRNAPAGFRQLSINGNNLLLNSPLGTGNVGIGAMPTPPDQKLTVASDTNNVNTNIGAFWANNRTVGVGIGYQDVRQILPNQPISLNAGTSGTVNIGNVSTGYVLLAAGGGNVGIGTSTPLARLHVNNGEILSTGDPAQQKGRVSARQFYGLNSGGAGKLVADFDRCYYA